MHGEWMEQEDEAEEDLQEYRREFKISKKMEQKLLNTKNLDCFEQRLDCFKVRNEFDQDCKMVAYEAFALYLKYPQTTIFRNKPSSEEDPYNDDDSNKTIGMEKYISFVANTKGSLYRNIEESLNAEFNEYGSIEEPTIYTPISRNTKIRKR